MLIQYSRWFVFVLVIVSSTLLHSGSSPASDFITEDKLGPSYQLTFDDVINHYIEVRMEVRADSEETILMMPVWTPGSYLVREYAKHIDRLEAKNFNGTVLAVEKISKNRWRVATIPGQSFVVQYRVFCNQRSVRTNWASQSYVILNGAPTFLTVVGQMSRPHLVKLDLPKRWSRSATSLVMESEAPHHFRAENYDELVDSPIVAGNIETYPFSVAGVKHYLVNVNELGIWDGPASTQDLARMVEVQHQFWGIVPYDRYYFINVIGGGGGGLEHDNSCLIMANQLAYRNEASYRRWLSLASHEFFHAWNVRRLRPKALVTYDYESEVYTPSLWIAEGITSYYQMLLLVRAGLVEESTYLNGLGNTISRYQRSDGRSVQSLRDSSHDTWIKFYRPEDNSSDTTVSYYEKGEIVGFLLDAQIRSSTNGLKSLDDAMRKLYREHSGDIGYSPEDFQRICSEVAGEDLSDWFELAVNSTEELDYQIAANWYGLRIGPINPAAGERQSRIDRSGSSSTRRTRPWIGIGVSGSPASKAGLAASDEILAIDGVRYSGEIDRHLRDLEIGDVIRVLISRDNKIEEVLVVLGSRSPDETWTIAKYSRATEQQRLNLDHWLTVQTTESIDDANAVDDDNSDTNEETAGEVTDDDKESANNNDWPPVDVENGQQGNEDGKR
ncbi:MAG TPA: hypothetical protein PKD64_05215 [Pirellulaceae bacterium]|nr:hypothetical protein [Pirellulaceae bacterium]HMO91576.1 hypothetical protein [Pirellulaceae bacterium]HMP68273.1 hypothetical protein [Pirellulaceae bacterium]